MHCRREKNLENISKMSVESMKIARNRFYLFIFFFLDRAKKQTGNSIRPALFNAATKNMGWNSRRETFSFVVYSELESSYSGDERATFIPLTLDGNIDSTYLFRASVLSPSIGYYNFSRVRRGTQGLSKIHGNEKKNRYVW